MNREERQHWGGYLRQLADQMGLRDWVAIIAEDPCPEERMAEVRCTYGRKRFTVRFMVGFGRLDPEEQRHTCVHELIHVHFAGHDQLGEDGRRAHNKDWLHRMLDDQHMLMEYAVDALAETLAPFLPLPPREAAADARLPDAGDDRPRPRRLPETREPERLTRTGVRRGG